MLHPWGIPDGNTKFCPDLLAFRSARRNRRAEAEAALAATNADASDLRAGHFGRSGGRPDVPPTTILPHFGELELPKKHKIPTNKANYLTKTGLEGYSLLLNVKNLKKRGGFCTIRAKTPYLCDAI
jgi:hypothetical protein